MVVVIISSQSAEKIFWCPPLFSCAHPIFDGIRGTTIKGGVAGTVSNCFLQCMSNAATRPPALHNRSKTTRLIGPYL